MKWEKLKPIVVLTAICVIVSAALVGTYGLTKPVIDAAKAAEANAALSAVLPDGADFEEVTVTAENVLNAYKAGNGAGYVFQAQGKGFAGMITVMVGISSDGAITGTQVMEHGETPGIGDRIEKEAHFQEQYLGKDYNLEGIEFLSGATFSSKGFNAAVGNAFVAYGELAGIAIEAPTEEKVYPDAELITEMLGEDLEPQIPGMCIVSDRYLVGGGLWGSIALIGPTRMPFQKLMPLLHYFADQLGEGMSGKRKDTPQAAAPRRTVIYKEDLE